VRLLFDQELEAKVINGRKLGGKELQTYFEVRSWCVLCCVLFRCALCNCLLFHT